MRKTSDIYEEIQKKKLELTTKQNQYSNLSQIACMDSYGILLYEQIQVLKGFIKALEWVLSNQFYNS